MIILETKLHIPVLPQKSIQRSRLRGIFEGGLTQSRLALVCAPAGYGKTTVLADWAGTSSTPVAWLSIAGEERDPESFLRYLFAAWEVVQPELAATSLGILLGSNSPDTQAVLSAFLNVASQLQQHLVFILDDYHRIENVDIHGAVAFLLDHLPPNLHFVLATRSEPPLPLARYRAHNHLLEIRNDDLRCTQEETFTFLNQSMGLDLSKEAAASLHANTEGWIAGLQLTALALQRAPRDSEDPLHVSGQHRFIADYLAEDVLAHLRPDLQDFLLETSLPDRLCGSLCEAVARVEDGQATLEHLERENLFLMALDGRREWFRYHQLFAEYLRRELEKRQPETIPELHRRAAHWYLAHDLPEEALQNAIAGDDAELVMQIAERYFEAKLLCGESRTLARWLDSLPEKWQIEYPLVAIFRTGVLLFTGAVEEGVHCIDELEQRLAVEDTKDIDGPLARVTAIRCSIACFQNELEQAEHYADTALRQLPEEDQAFRAAIHHALGDTYRRNGRWEEARASYLKVLDLFNAPSFYVRSVHVYGALADLELQQGRLQRSADYWNKALSVIEQREAWGRFPMPLIGWVYIRLGEILYEWNDLEKSESYLSEGLQRSEMGGDVRAMVAGYLLAGRLRLAAGDIPAAAEYLERARPLVRSASFPEWVGRFGRFQLEVWLAQDKLRSASNWADEMMQDDRLDGQLETGSAQLAMARVLILKGDMASLDQARAFLDRLIEGAEEEGRMGIQVEALALQALGSWRRGDQPGALVGLEHALRLARPEGYMRLFADLGYPMARLLQEARSRGVTPEYIDTLLAAFDGNVAAPHQQTLPEPLTPREQEILGLMAAGLTNIEIAERLVVSPGTIKKHSSNIYEKLGVRSRTAAATKARALDLLN